MTEPRVSDERLARIHAERPHLVIQDDEFQRLAMDLSDARAALRAAEATIEKLMANGARLVEYQAESLITERDAALAQVAALAAEKGESDARALLAEAERVLALADTSLHEQDGLISGPAWDSVRALLAKIKAHRETMKAGENDAASGDPGLRAGSLPSTQAATPDSPTIQSWIDYYNPDEAVLVAQRNEAKRVLDAAIAKANAERDAALSQVAALAAEKGESDARALLAEAERVLTRVSKLDCGDCVRGMAEGQNDPDRPIYCGCVSGQSAALLAKLKAHREGR